MSKELLTIFKKGTAYAKRKRGMLENHQDAEDFGSYCVERKLKQSYSRLDWMFVDYLREGSGRKGSNGYDQKSALKRATSLNAVIGDSTTDRIELIDVGCGGSDLKNREKINDFKRTLRAKNQRHKEMIDMFFKNFKHKEIAEKFGISTSRVSQILSFYIEPKKKLREFSFADLKSLSKEVKAWLSKN